MTCPAAVVHLEQELQPLGLLEGLFPASASRLRSRQEGDVGRNTIHGPVGPVDFSFLKNFKNPMVLGALQPSISRGDLQPVQPL